MSFNPGRKRLKPVKRFGVEKQKLSRREQHEKMEAALAKKKQRFVKFRKSIASSWFGQRDSPSRTVSVLTTPMPRLDYELLRSGAAHVIARGAGVVALAFRDGTYGGLHLTREI